MTSKLIVLLVASALLGAQSVMAQRIQGPRFAGGTVWAAESPALAAAATFSNGILGDGSKDYRYAGFVVGAGAGVWLGYELSQFCLDSEEECNTGPAGAVLGAVLVGALVGTFGALIGAQFDR